MKRISLPYWVASVLLVALVSCSDVFGDDAKVDGNKEASSISKDDMNELRPEQAVAAAAADIGLKMYDARSVVVSKAAFGDESVPFLRESLKGKSVYRVVFKNIELAEASGNDEAFNSFIQTLVAFVSIETGRVVKVSSAWPVKCDRIADVPTCAEEERQLGDSERYVKLAEKPPRTTLVKAITESRPWSQNVMQIHAYHVLHTCNGHKNRPVWIVQIRGVEAIPTRARIDPNREMPDDAFNHLRNVIDSDTGEWLWADTIPQPAGPVELRY